MASSQGNDHSDTAKKEQIITEFFAKSLHIIHESRAPYVSSRNSSVEPNVSSPSSSSSSPSTHRPRDKWFNLALAECPAALENIDFWRQSNLDPMIIDVVLVHGAAKPELAEREGFHEAISENVLERWVVKYETRKSKDSSSRSKRSCGNLPEFYKKSVLLLRSLYTTVRLLPAYKFFRELISSGHLRNYTLTHRVNTFVEPFTRKEEAGMRRFRFTPVDTSTGRLCLSVLYHDASVTDLDLHQLTPMSPQFIRDYVGSPKVDPVKRISSMPVSHSLPSYALFSRQSPTQPQPRSHLPPMSLPNNMNDTYQAKMKSDGFDDNRPPPAYSFSRRPQLTLMKPGEKAEKSSGAGGGSVGEKFSLGRDENGRFSGPRSRSFSIQDDYDDADFCHFAVNGDVIMDPGSRAGNLDPSKQTSDPFEPYGWSPAMKSEEAAVGALILMLKRAPPLQHNALTDEPTTYSSSMASSRLVVTKTTADALAELGSFSGVKERLLKQQGSVAKPQISVKGICYTLFRN